MLLESTDLRLFVSSYTLKSCQYTGQSSSLRAIRAYAVPTLSAGPLLFTCSAVVNVWPPCCICIFESYFWPCAFRKHIQNLTVPASQRTLLVKVGSWLER